MSKLDAAEAVQPLTEPAASRLDKLEIFASIASTNTYLMSQQPPAAGRYRVAIADQQTSGRGRHQRRWVSEPGAGLYMSLAYSFEKSMRDLGGLTLAIGVGVAEALEGLDVPGIALKWPNDIVALDGKLGGILTELQTRAGEGATVVIGVGLNLAMPDQFDRVSAPDRALRPVDLRSVVDVPPERGQLAAVLIEHLYGTLDRFGSDDAGGFLPAWRRRDWLLGRDIVVETPTGLFTGSAAGVGDDGALLVDTPGGRVSVLSGSITTAGPVGVHA